MLVEDDTGEVLLIQEILAETPLPIKLHVARDGMQALLMLASGVFQPNLIVVDLNIPYISGHGVIQRFHPKERPGSGL